MKHRFPLSGIPRGESRGLTLQTGNEAISVIAVRVGDSVNCYRNRCPHTGVNLDWIADRFLDSSGEYIQCATHGALFRITDGYCVFGPCVGQGLDLLKVTIDGDFFEIHMK